MSEPREAGTPNEKVRRYVNWGAIRVVVAGAAVILGYLQFLTDINLVGLVIGLFEFTAGDYF